MSVSLQEKKGVYYAVFRVVDINGETKQKWVSTKVPVKRGNKREAQRAAQEIAGKFEEGKIVAYPRTPFWQWLETWLEQKENEVDRITFQGYASYYRNHIGPYFKQHNVTLNDISPQDIQLYYNRKAQKPGEHVKGKLSGKSLHDHHIVIRGALQDAVKKNIIPYNPADRVTLPKKQKYVGNFYTQEQSKALLGAIKGTVIEYIVTFTIVYGLRRSEAVGLKWSAINFENDTFTIEATVVRFSEILEKQTTKNQASHRTYPMTPDIRQMLLSIKERQEEMKELLGSSYVDSGYVFTWDDGRILNPDFVSRKFTQILKANGLPHIRYHDLRHTTASLLIAKGYDIKRVSEWLGHSDIATTANIYGHLSFENKKGTLAAMSDLLSDGKNQGTC